MITAAQAVGAPPVTESVTPGSGTSPGTLPRPAERGPAARGKAPSSASRPKVVVVGAGFAGMNAVRALASAPVDIVLIDRENHHLFQPLLYQVATAALSPANIAWPIRRLVRHQRNVRVLLGDVTGVDRARRVVQLEGREIAFDWLVLATGAAHSYFGNDQWAPHAPGLKCLDDATAIRRRLLMAFEQAEMEPDPERCGSLLNFVVVGGGPTGVELAGAIAELARKALADDFRAIDPRRARVVLVEAGPRVLPGFPEGLTRYAERALERLGVEVRTDVPVTDCRADGVQLGEDEFMQAGIVLWAAGVAASPAASWLGVEGDRAGRVRVDARLALPDDPRIFVVGDTALVLDEEDEPLPGIAPVAKQQGDYVGQAIAAGVAGRTPEPFRYADRGQLATIGRRAAVIRYRNLELKGRVAWWLWGLAHIYFLIGMRSRLMVATNWLWSYATFERGARLITGMRDTRDGSPTDDRHTPAEDPGD